MTTFDFVEACMEYIKTNAFENLSGFIEHCKDENSVSNLGNTIHHVIAQAINYSRSLKKSESAELREWIFMAISVQPDDHSVYVETCNDFCLEYCEDILSGLAIGSDKVKFYTDSSINKLRVSVSSYKSKHYLNKIENERLVHLGIANFNRYQNDEDKDPIVSFDFEDNRISRTLISPYRPNDMINHIKYDSRSDEQKCHVIGHRWIKDFIEVYFSGKDIDLVINAIRAERINLMAILGIEKWPDYPEEYDKSIFDYSSEVKKYTDEMNVIQAHADTKMLSATQKAFILFSGFDEQIKSGASLLHKRLYFARAVAHFYRDSTYNPYNLFIGLKKHNESSGKYNLLLYNHMRNVMHGVDVKFPLSVNAREISTIDELKGIIDFEQTAGRKHPSIAFESKDMLLNHYFGTSYDQSNEACEPNWPKPKLNNAMNLFLYTYDPSERSIGNEASQTDVKKQKINKYFPGNI